MKGFLFFALFGCVMGVAMADDTPTIQGADTPTMQGPDTPTAEVGAERYDQKMCIQRYTNECISSICITSEALDCNSQCKTSAENKCPANPP